MAVRIDKDGIKHPIKHYVTSDARLAICRRCGLIMHDCEPFTSHGEYWHDNNRDGCPNSGRYMRFKGGELKAWSNKKLRRARKRGARLARKPGSPGTCNE